MRPRHPARINSAGESVIVEWRGEKIGHYNAAAKDTWTTHTIKLIGSGGLDRLVFREWDKSDGSGPLLDNISLRAKFRTPKPGDELLINGSFEANQVPDKAVKAFRDSQVEGWTSLNGQPLEMWGSLFEGVPASDGQTLLELDYARGHKLDGIYQVRFIGVVQLLVSTCMIHHCMFSLI